MKPTDKVYVAGHQGLVGSALVRRLEQEGFDNLLMPSRAELDLTEPGAVREFFAANTPDFVFMAAAKVGGIMANATYPVEFIRDNLMIELSVIEAAHHVGVQKLLFLGSSCVYPKEAPQPIKEDYLLTGPLEPTNQWYAIAKIAGIRLCQAYASQYGDHFVSVMPTNIYGPGDNFDLATGHVLPALIRRFHEARERGDAVVSIWGSGKPRREFLYADDLADACVYLMRNSAEEDLINIGVGKDITITELAELVSEIVGFEGRIEYDRSKPDGTMRKLLDVSKVNALGWTATTGLREGITRAYEWYIQHLVGGAV